MATLETTSNVNLPLTGEDWGKLKHFLLAYERGYVPTNILALAERVKQTTDGAKILALQERWVWIQAQRNQD